MTMAERSGEGQEVMGFYYPIPAGALVTCMHCQGLLSKHMDGNGGWRGCIEGGETIPDAHPVLLVTNRRVGPERRGLDAAAELHVEAAPVLVRSIDGDSGRGHARPVPPPPAFVAGPRGAVYVALAHARSTGQAGLTGKVLETIIKSGQDGKSGAELRKELKVKPKSLESILYRLRLGGMIRSYNASDVRGR